MTSFHLSCQTRATESRWHHQNVSRRPIHAGNRASRCERIDIEQSRERAGKRRSRSRENAVGNVTARACGPRSRPVWWRWCRPRRSPPRDQRPGRLTGISGAITLVGAAPPTSDKTWRAIAAMIAGPRRRRECAVVNVCDSCWCGDWRSDPSPRARSSSRVVVVQQVRRRSCGVARSMPSSRPVLQQRMLDFSALLRLPRGGESQAKASSDSATR